MTPTIGQTSDSTVEEWWRSLPEQEPLRLSRAVEAEEEGSDQELERVPPLEEEGSSRGTISPAGMELMEFVTSDQSSPSEWTERRIEPDRHLLGLPRRRVAGEIFYLDREGDQILLRHDRWSLLGTGRSLLEAEQDLREEGREIRDILLSKSPATLSHQARKLQVFLLRLT